MMDTVRLRNTDNCRHHVGKAWYAEISWQMDMLLSIKQFIVDRCPVPLWLRRAGLAGFLFFLIKGLLWLVVPALLVIFGYES